MSRRGATRLLLLLFLGSGATSLVYEVLWARQLHLVFGTSQLAICTVLSAFMAGLALGGFGAARWGHRVARPLLAYSVLEALIGLYAILFPYILKLVTPVYLGFWKTFEPSPLLFGGFQFLLLGALLLPPTVCMGATLPLLVRFVTAMPEDAGYQVGRLYGVNTLGAVLGTGLAGFVLLPGMGLAASTEWAASANGFLALAAAGLAFLSARKAPAEEPTKEAPSAPEGGHEASSLTVPLMVVAALAGFSSLLYEVAWFRLMTLILGGSVYAFSIMLVAFLLGIGIGGWVGGWLADTSFSRGGRARVLRFLAGLQIGVALLTWSAMYLYEQLPSLFLRLYSIAESRLEALELLYRLPVVLWGAKLLLALCIMLPPALLMGATFPYLVRAASSSLSTLSRPVGHLYGMNTLGGIAGAGLGGLLFLPFLFVRGSVLVGVSVNLTAALISGWLAMVVAGRIRRIRFVVGTLAVVAAVFAVHWKRPPWDPLLMTSGSYIHASDMEKGQRTREGLVEFAVEPFELAFYREGLSSVVTVGRSREGENIWLANNGKIDASLEDMDTQLLLAHLPLAFRPQARRILIIGLASGITTGSITLYRSLEQIDVVEIEEAIVAASHMFDEYNHRPLEDDRVRLYINDARNHLLLAPDGTYDLVSSEPSNPWLSGVSNLFTREFFMLGKRKLAPNGVWVQWVHTYGMHRSDLVSLFATFADVYADFQLFRVDDMDLLLVGSDVPLSFQTSEIARTFRENTAVAEELDSIGLHRAEDILSHYLFGRKTLLRIAGGAGLNTDDNMRIEHSAPFYLHFGTSEDNSAMLEKEARIPIRVVKGKDQWLALSRAYADRDLSLRRAYEALAQAEALSPGDPEVAAERMRLRQREH